VRANLDPPPPPAAGYVKLVVTPWAEIAVDGQSVGTTPLKPLRLLPGPHMLLLSHPDYWSHQRKVIVKSGETLQLEVDLTQEAFRKSSPKR